jgi:two-component system OmpR family response regulator
LGGDLVRILLVEDHPKTAALVARGLRESTYAVDVAADADEALWYAGELAYDAVLLDVMLAGRDGFEVLAELRAADCWAPVIMVTARSSVADRVLGLDLGADDYLVKPFSVDELLARVRAVIRRGAHPRASTIVVGDLVIDPARHTVTRGDVEIPLTPKEFALLEVLARRPGDTVGRRELLESCWDFAFSGDPNVLDVFIRTLRLKVDRPFGRHSIETVRGVGYRLHADESVVRSS